MIFLANDDGTTLAVYVWVDRYGREWSVALEPGWCRAICLDERNRTEEGTVDLHTGCFDDHDTVGVMTMLVAMTLDGCDELGPGTEATDIN